LSVVRVRDKQKRLIIMPKAFKGENTKAVEAKLRKSGAVKAEQEKKQKAAEDAAWEDDDKLNLKKQGRKVSGRHPTSKQ
jgi:hypothetical protein